jgi:hypothetical protein
MKFAPDLKVETLVKVKKKMISHKHKSFLIFFTKKIKNLKASWFAMNDAFVYSLTTTRPI